MWKKCSKKKEDRKRAIEGGETEDKEARLKSLEVLLRDKGKEAISLSSEKRMNRTKNRRKDMAEITIREINQEKVENRKEEIQIIIMLKNKDLRPKNGMIYSKMIKTLIPAPQEL